MKRAEVENIDYIRQQITDAKGTGGDTKPLVARLIELEKRTKQTKKPRINTP